jgi:peroxiredoxin
MLGLDMGSRVADLTFLRPDGSPVRLSEFQGPLLLIFLRHLRCISCLGHVAEVRDHLDGFRHAGVEVLVVTQSTPEALAAAPLPLQTVCDPERTAYRYFGLDRGRWSMFFRWGVLARYLRLIFAGWRPHRGEAREDMLQLGGDFLLSADRHLLYAHRSNDPADRPTAAALVEQLQHLTRPPTHDAAREAISPQEGYAR